MKKLALIDIDKTIYNGYTIFDLAEKQFADKILSKECIHKLFSDLDNYKNQAISYESFVKMLNDHWLEGLKGKSYSKIWDYADQYFKSHQFKFFSFVSELFQVLADTHDCYLITGEMQFVAEPIAKLLNTKGFRATTLAVKEDLITGQVLNYLASRAEKKIAIIELVDQYDKAGSIALGDSAGDIEMLAAVEQAFCINAAPELREVGLQKGWSFVNENSILESVYRYLGI
ncbi:MAG: haloacid dehalogenase-like hydrolase [bacterium]